MHTKSIVGLFLIGAWCSVSEIASAQTPFNEFELTVRFDEPIAERPTALVFVGGELAGVAPGTIVGSRTFPLDAEIEIGIAQLSPNPLYSFALGPKSFADRRVEVVMSTFGFGFSNTDRLWSGLLQSPNIKKLIALEETKPGSYSVVLPAQPYQDVAKYYATKVDGTLKQSRFGTVSKENNQSGALGFVHLGYNKAEGRTVPVDGKTDGVWSGSYAKKAGLFDGLDLPTERWTVISNPPDATIYTAEGPQGSTTTTISIAKTGSTYVILKKDGYQPCLHKDCQRTDTKGGTVLTCNLKKLR
jgi:hypothetical protein